MSLASTATIASDIRMSAHSSDDAKDSPSLNIFPMTQPCTSHFIFSSTPPLGIFDRLLMPTGDTIDENVHLEFLAQNPLHLTPSTHSATPPDTIAQTIISLDGFEGHDHKLAGRKRAQTSSPDYLHTQGLDTAALHQMLNHLKIRVEAL
ncbi:hypothetical protein J056_000072 [Wallemia ichthyophaga EXF-994]|uniref:Uncharacterized protein n=1 Tax=Wallemia ichthyophaga (strain EXF-994 / CBS 113033) TaxID=1299270 RepID=R9ARR0_WALI9|nr:uncharacterized protein J056_000072 [Wallemia ichthyophaga EXF-994]EOR04735.1 hypothetical protein J056_000072 [Wallemia ichthyophaga EXF-994]